MPFNKGYIHLSDLAFLSTLDSDDIERWSTAKIKENLDTMRLRKRTDTMQERMQELRDNRFRDALFDAMSVPITTLSGTTFGFPYRANLKNALRQISGYRNKEWGRNAFRVALLSMQRNDFTIPVYLLGDPVQPSNQDFDHLLLILPWNKAWCALLYNYNGGDQQTLRTADDREICPKLHNAAITLVEYMCGDPQAAKLVEAVGGTLNDTGCEAEERILAFRDALVLIESISVSTVGRNYAAVHPLDLRNNILAGIAKLPVEAGDDDATQSTNKRKRTA